MVEQAEPLQCVDHPSDEIAPFATQIWAANRLKNGRAEPLQSANLPSDEIAPSATQIWAGNRLKMVEQAEPLQCVDLPSDEIEHFATQIWPGNRLTMVEQSRFNVSIRRNRALCDPNLARKSAEKGPSTAAAMCRPLRPKCGQEIG